MTVRNILVGLGAGLAAALLFAGLVRGTTLALPLFLLSPLPIAIAGLGFGTISGAIGAVFAATLIGAVFVPLSGLFHFLGFGAPVAWAAHLIGLARSNPGAPEEREWFPLDRVLFRLTIAAAVAVTLIGMVFGYDPKSWTDIVLTGADAMFADAGADAPSRADFEPIVSMVVSLMPITSAMLILAVAVFNSWLGARIARLSGQMQRPWTPVWTVSLPKMAAIVLGLALLAWFLPGPPGYIGGTFLGAMACAFAMTGFGLLHFSLVGKASRGAVLFGTYLATLLFTVPIVVAAIGGIADTLLGIRSRRRN